MRRTLLLLLSLCCTPLQAYAQSNAPVDLLDQSLFNSEPVEEVPEDAPAAPAATPPSPPAPAAAPAEPATEYDIALLQGLKKATAETSTFEAPINVPVTFGGLTITVKKCVKSSPGVRPENSALLLIQDAKQGTMPITVFSGWMFSSSPAISALEHPVYDITMLECVMKKKPPEPEAVHEKPPAKSKAKSKKRQS